MQTNVLNSSTAPSIASPPDHGFHARLDATEDREVRWKLAEGFGNVMQECEGFKLHSDSRSKYLLIQPEGSLDRASARVFQEETDALCAQSIGSVVIDMKQVPSIDSHGLGALVRLQKRLTDGHRAMALVQCQDGVQQLLSLTRLEILIPIYRDLSEMARVEIHR